MFYFDIFNVEFHTVSLRKENLAIALVGRTYTTLYLIHKDQLPTYTHFRVSESNKWLLEKNRAQ